MTVGGRVAPGALGGFHRRRGLEGWPRRSSDRRRRWFVGSEASGDGATGQIVGEVGWAGPPSSLVNTNQRGYSLYFISRLD